MLNDVMETAPNVVAKGRLGPGQMVVADLTTGQFFENSDISRKVRASLASQPWGL